MLSMPPFDISLPQARRIALNAALLDGRTRLPQGEAGALRVIERLGYVQLDTIAVVERAHHHTLWTRLPGYTPGQVEALLAQRRIFEYWGHAASFLPLADYRYFLPEMRRHRERPQPWVAGQREKVAGLLPQVLERIRTEGPLKAADFDSPRPGGSAWWGWKPAKSALELLFWEGELMIAAREGFQRVYDLTQRVLPQGTDTREPDAAELGRFAVRRALQAHGVLREKDITDHLRLRSADVPGALRELCAAGEVAPVRVQGEAFQYYAPAVGLDAGLKLRAPRPRLQILSPFDNLAIQRDRLARLFNYVYTIECYVPEPKRTYGYFCLPLLWGEAFAGRLDAKAERKAGVLSVRGLWLEAGIDAGAEFYAALAGKLREFAAFNGCTDVRIADSVAQDVRNSLRRALNGGS